MIRKKIYLLLLLMPLLHGCKESDFNDLLDRQGDQRKELQELTDLCKKLNEDIYNLQVIVNTDRIGDNITHIEELADGAGYILSPSPKVLRLLSVTGRKEIPVRMEMSGKTA